jgi:hypothetical protein
LDGGISQGTTNEVVWLDGHLLLHAPKLDSRASILKNLSGSATLAIEFRFRHEALDCDDGTEVIFAGRELSFF